MIRALARLLIVSDSVCTSDDEVSGDQESNKHAD